MQQRLNLGVSQSTQAPSLSGFCKQTESLGYQNSFVVIGEREPHERQVRTRSVSTLQTLGEKLFDVTAAVKVWTAQLAMHLPLDARDRLFRQIDTLHDAEEWTESDTPVSIESYKTLVRAIIYHKIDSRPSLALMPTGNILALWKDGIDKLTIEFLPEMRARWLVQNHTTAGAERVSGTGPLERLSDNLAAYGAERWFNGS